MRKVYIFVIATFLLTSKCFGQSAIWNGSISNDFALAANWTPNRNSPSAADILTFNTTAPLVINTVGTQTIAGIIVTGAFPVSMVAAGPTNILTISGATPITLATGSSLLISTVLTLQLNSDATLSSGILGIEPNTGGKLIINKLLNITGGTLNIDVPGTGGTTVNTTGIITYSSGTFLCSTPGAITYQTGAVYNHAKNGGIIPAATWIGGSFCNITGITTTAPSGIDGIDFANFTWNCIGQTANVDLMLPTATVNINGVFSMISTGVGTNSLRLASAVGNTGTLRAASYTQTGGTLMIQSMGGNNTLIVTGAFLQSGGILDGVGNGAGGTANLDFKGSVTKSALWQSSSSSANAVVNIQFSGGAPQAVSLAGAWYNPNGGRTNIAITNRNNTGVVLAGGSVLKVHNTSSTSAATCTMAGIITPGAPSSVVSYTRTGLGGLSLIYQGVFFQTASVPEFPVTNGPIDLTINNPLGVKFPVSFTRTIPGTLTMMRGNLALETDTLFLTNPSLAAQVVLIPLTSGRITTGTLAKSFPSTGLPTAVANGGLFPFGTGINDRSLDLYFFTSAITTGGKVYVTHNPVVGINTSSTFSDNPIIIDRTTLTNWKISTDAGFSLGGNTAALNVVAENIGAVDNFSYLHLTDRNPNYGVFSATTGTNSKPVLTKTDLTLANINSTIYVGSDHITHNNPLLIITFTWTGGGLDDDWTNPLNWTGSGAVGYPSAPTENAIIESTLLYKPLIKTGIDVSVYQLTLKAPMILNMATNSKLTVYDDIPVYSGAVNFAPLSEFGYAGSGATQNIRGDLWVYANLTLSGTAQKIFPATITVWGKYDISGNPLPVFNNNNFIYAGPANQDISPANYYDLTITGNRGGGYVTLGRTPYNEIIDIKHNFNVSGLSNYKHYPPTPLQTLGFYNNTKVNFSSPDPTVIPGFWYSFITNSSGDRTFDPLGATDSSHVIYCRGEDRTASVYNLDGSKINNYITGANNVTYTTGKYYDYEISGDGNNKVLDFFSGRISIKGNFTVSLTNYQQKANTITYFVFEGAGDQTINGFKTDAFTNTPAFIYPNIIVEGKNRNVTLGKRDTIKITGSLQVPRSIGYAATGSFWVNPFVGANGFLVDSSTVNFSVGSGLLPTLKPANGTNNYHSVTITGGTRIMESNMQLGGNLTVGGADLNAITGASPAVLKIGDGASNRILNILGDTVTVNGTSGISQITGQIDLNSGTSGSTIMNLSGSLFINGQGQMMNTGASNGTVIFKGVKPHNYLKTSLYNNEFVNFTVGDGVTSSKLSLLSSLDLVGSGTTAGKIGTLSVLATDTLDCGTNNVYGLGTDGYAKFDLKANATLVTANTGGVEGVASSSSTGSIRNDLKLVRNYDSTASYVFNAQAATNTNFPAVTTPFPMANLTLDNTTTAAFTLNKSIDVSNTLTLRNSATLAVSESNLNLKSTSAATARIAPVPNTANITYGTDGRFVVERYYPARRAWRLITAPVSVDVSSKSVFDSWQMGGAVTSGSGMFVSGPSANPASNGLDISPQNKFSLKYFDGTNLVGVPDTKAQKISGTFISTTVPANFGLFAFVRGDRSSTSLFNTSMQNNTTLRDTGKVQIKGQEFTLPGAVDSYALIGNPYASPVNVTDFMNVSSNIDKSNIWIWDPNLNTDQGGYVTYSYSGGVWVPSVPSTTFPAGHIQSSQAFLVKKTSALDGKIPFVESHKITNNSNGAFRPMAQPAMFRTILNLREANNSNILADGNVVIFDDAFSAGIDDGDAFKFGNILENFGLLRDTKLLAVERRPTIVADDTLFFKLTKTTQRKYEFQFEPTNMDPLLIGFLEDNYTGIKTPVSLTAATSFNFVVNGDAKSAAADRFRIVFKTTGAGPLPVTYTSIKAYQQNKDIMVDWTVENEINTARYEVEKSTDGVSYFKINTINAKGANSSSTNYKFLDQNVSEGNNFYRILSYGQNGTVEYSRILLVKISKASGAGISIYPNPVTDNNIGLSFNNLVAGVYNVRVINTIGQVVLTKAVNHSNGNSIETINVNVKLNTGIYQVEVTGPGNKISVVKMIVQ